MPYYLVDVESVAVNTYRVQADSEEEAKERFSDGLVVHSEATSPIVRSATFEA
ncbi:hypothetical protein SEA_GUYFAGIERI_72 [Rhodococcus phage GuyFagieri]|nr:hypothetical protein SEA_GUYFAGIERI_72 [Rhodococcus phage GuyFagieri]